MSVLLEQNILFAIFFLIWCSLFSGSLPVQAGPYACIIIDPVTGYVLHEVNGETHIPPASLTKLMTLRLTFKALISGRLSLNQRLPVSALAQSQQPAKLGLKAGETITVKEAILALIVKSANDVAVVLGEALGQTEGAFAKQMNQEAKKLGMLQTTFCNASGLPHSQQLTTARDMAILSLAIGHFPQYYHYFRTKSFQFRGKTYKSHNKLLGKVHGVIGLKTGYTSLSGYNLSASVVRGKRRLIIVVLGGLSAQWRDDHMTNLINTAYNSPPQVLPLLTAGLGLTGSRRRIEVPRPESPLKWMSRRNFTPRG